jgi:hypothetical protein
VEISINPRSGAACGADVIREIKSTNERVALLEELLTDAQVIKTNETVQFVRVPIQNSKLSKILIETRDKVYKDPERFINPDSYRFDSKRIEKTMFDWMAKGAIDAVSAVIQKSDLSPPRKNELIRDIRKELL